MNFITSIFLFAGLASGICVAYFLGHALSTGSGFWYIAAGIALVVSATMISIARALAPKEASGTGH